MVESEWPEDFIGKNTKQSIQTGVLQGMVHELDGFINQYISRFGPVTLLICGGDALLFKKQSNQLLQHQPYLIEEGMNMVLINS